VTRREGADASTDETLAGRADDDPGFRRVEGHNDEGERLMNRRLSLSVLGGVALLAAAPAASRADLPHYEQHNLVSDIPGMADNLDPNLKNPWGISHSATSPFWVSDQVTGVTTLYNGTGTPLAKFNIQPTGGGNPTGQVFNSTPDFALTPGGPKAIFLFASLNGTIQGWNPASGSTDAIIKADNSGAGAVYTGLALGVSAAGSTLFAANDAQGKIDAFNGTFGAANLAGNFTDPNLPAGFTPYNIQNIAGTLYVTYENEATGGGVINAFDLNGNFLRRVTSNDASGPLQSPWGMALASSSFGTFAGDLLVGNEDDGHISAFDPTTGAFRGQLLDQNGNPIANEGQWGLTFGNGGNGGRRDTLYFAAGINGEANGLFGSISAVPEPGSVVLLGLGGAFAFVTYRRKAGGVG